MDKCRVPASHLLGQEGQGFIIAMKVINSLSSRLNQGQGLDGGRINIGACSLGGAYACLKAAKEHTKVRKQFKTELASFQTVQFKLASMATKLHSSRLMVCSNINVSHTIRR